MTARILDGKAIANALLLDIRRQVEERIASGGRAPGLAVILVGDNPASALYVRNKRRSCEIAGVRDLAHNLPATTTQAELLTLIDRLNDDDDVDGIMVQLPLPEHIPAEAVIERIRPDKDVDGFHPYNLGRLAQKRPALRPCTPYGVMRLLATTNEELRGKEAVVVGASNIVGRPMALELMMAGCTVTVCHSATRNLPAHVGRAEVLVAAVGRSEMVRGKWLREGVVVIDVGINRLLDGRVVGDVEFETARERAAWITPVPGGVGPMTVATLLQNTLEAAAGRQA
ncbi:MAG: bifunctional methylenetetrahydrofolate dehydrogenase/methenyltetrahydrofolate cyclohydrolase FolD [Hydrogenophilales bacterium CG03_land_8_20_14_0_80_62_28]|nr:bifunctional methylenetetrahydrofolate dehydrogenase/methenyltetrahydrofolate cyclohydrolase FolD [Betaproteobacteria bacterium]OIO79137.1 MAG: bifunctional methylenetetrahydrofolate dehydrogenase/methenyltetrahydrofolate cyclohydrolase [Hydrogenophilaceae bacterium CG1_02_62_390]PIV23796.1 MAG: bifunctional methylenetetrahydrofolate dehydrogenase/methenyltetrahydrofolate cyclohydrolase FolD [Hydrogenophilales bacterium CG03_land_8_20_14_0_80_62_28]PIW37692.1 MAG: bifunctional methylenetetrah